MCDELHKCNCDESNMQAITWAFFCDESTAKITKGLRSEVAASYTHKQSRYPEEIHSLT